MKARNLRKDYLIEEEFVYLRVIEVFPPCDDPGLVKVIARSFRKGHSTGLPTERFYDPDQEITVH